MEVADARQAVQQVLKMRKKVEMKVVWVLSGASRERRTQPVGVSMERRMWPAEVMEVESLEASGRVVALGGAHEWGNEVRARRRGPGIREVDGPCWGSGAGVCEMMRKQGRRGGTAESEGRRGGSGELELRNMRGGRSVRCGSWTGKVG